MHVAQAYLIYLGLDFCGHCTHLMTLNESRRDNG